MNKYIDDLVRRFPPLESCADDIFSVFEALYQIYKSDGKLLLCGNGGSAADAEHWSGELLKGFMKKRPLSAAESENMRPELASRLQGALPTIPLTGFTSFRSAFDNDVDPVYVYAQQVWALGREGDAFVGISTSGNAKNVCLAAEVARARGMTTIALTGEDGGRLVELTSMSIKVPAKACHFIQEYHLPVYHCLSLMLEDAFFSR